VRDGFVNIAVTREGESATVLLNRPEKLNPLDWITVKELLRAVQELAEDPTLRTIVFRGAGRSFSAGGDLEKYIELFKSPTDMKSFMETFYQLFELMEQSRIVFIAAVNGVCVAGGLELLLACDLVIASDDARIGDGHLNFSQLPGAGSSVRLWRAIGSVRAKHIVMTGELLSAHEALQIGLVGQVAGAAEFDAAVADLVRRIHEKSRSSLIGAKRLLNEAVRSGLDAALRKEIAFVHEYATTQADPIEGLIAFREKRSPKYGSDPSE